MMNNTVRNIACQLSEWIKYKIVSGHKKGHGIHSPFVFDMIVQCFNDKKKYNHYEQIENILKELRKSKEEISFIELGGGSRRMKENNRKVRDIAGNASVNKKYGRLLFRLARHYKPSCILEIGTSLGISTLYMALGNSNSTIHTIEGNENVSKIARKQAQKLNCQNIEFHCGLFDEILPGLLANIPSPEIVFIDGNHTYDATIRYVNQVILHMKEGIILIDDIYWSCNMRRAWKKIQRQNAVTIDLFEMGIVIVRDSITEGMYRVRF